MKWLKAAMVVLGQGPVEVVQLDLADLAAVKRGAQQIHEVAPHIDYVILNAGVRCFRPSMKGGTNDLVSKRTLKSKHSQIYALIWYRHGRQQLLPLRHPNICSHWLNFDASVLCRSWGARSRIRLTALRCSWARITWGIGL